MARRLTSQRRAGFRRATELLAAAHDRPCTGEQRCFYCGAACDGSLPLELSTSFTDWWNVSFPDSKSICNGCDIALDEKIDMPGRDKPQKTRSWSWLLTPDKATPIGDIAKVRSVCLSPPVGAWALTIAVSGQKHLLFRARANSGSEPFIVQLETEQVVYRVDELRERLSLAKKLAAVVGKPGLTSGLDAVTYLRLSDSCSELEIKEWFSLAASPVSRLASHICPPKIECLNERDSKT